MLAVPAAVTQATSCQPVRQSGVLLGDLLKRGVYQRPSLDHRVVPRIARPASAVACVNVPYATAGTANAAEGAVVVREAPGLKASP
jgi:hypothetical protein